MSAGAPDRSRDPGPREAAQKFHEVFAGYSRWAVPWGQEAEVGWATLQARAAPPPRGARCTRRRR
eukprot:3955167-Pyramimonas_sp.AAC.1